MISTTERKTPLQDKSKYDDARQEEARFKELVFPEKATELLKKLKNSGVADCEVLMFARAYGNNVAKWNAMLQDMLERGVLKQFNVDDLMNEQTLNEICDVLKANGYIKDFGDGLKEIDWFIANFGHESFLAREDKRHSGLFDRQCAVWRRWNRECPLTRIYEFNAHYIKFNGVSEGLKAAVREYLEFNLDYVSYTTWTSAVYRMEGPDEEDYLAMRVKLAPHVNKVLEMLLLDYVMEEEYREIYCFGRLGL